MKTREKIKIKMERDDLFGGGGEGRKKGREMGVGELRCKSISDARNITYIKEVGTLQNQ